MQDGGTSIANISGTVSAEGELAAAIFHKSGSGHTVNLAESAVIEGSISAANEASNNILVYDEDADYELTIGGEVDVETGSRTKSKEQAQVSGASTSKMTTDSCLQRSEWNRSRRCKSR